MLRTIVVGSCVSVQGTFVAQLDSPCVRIASRADIAPALSVLSEGRR